MSIASEVAAALEEAAIETGGQKLVAQIIRPAEKDESTYPPTVGAPTAFTFTALMDTFSKADRDTGNVQSGDIKVLLEQGPAEPLTSDKIKIAGITYAIQGVESLSPGGVALMWTIHARGGVPDDTTYLPGSDLGSVEDISDLPPLP